jgi:hypothetical protein
VAVRHFFIHELLKNMNDWTEEQKKVWVEWLAERPDNVRKVAEAFPPNRKYRLRGQDPALGNYYIPQQYDEHEDGSVTMTCAKLNDEFPLLGGYGVFGMKPEGLEAIEP